MWYDIQMDGVEFLELTIGEGVTFEPQGLLSLCFLNLKHFDIDLNFMVC